MEQMIKENTELKNEVKKLKNIIKIFYNMQTKKNTEQLTAQKNIQENNEHITENTTSSSLDIEESDYPTLSTNNLPPEEIIGEAPLSYGQVTKNKNKQNRKKNIRYPAHNPTEKDLTIAERIFQERDPEETNKVIYVYVPVHRRMRSNELRKKIILLGIDNIQVLNVYCPDSTAARYSVARSFLPRQLYFFRTTAIYFKRKK
ncbi:hypothetical protein BDF21DRAFT_19924 [Thamnidium elegans]|nr:hypothetical protein BDF21DRAFT_19924 [Thamnidium elegans]